ncbi:MAG: cyclic nucleotide-binding domain-containing protein [Parachlamydiales bacterium]|jgi:CRP-like cAMP-binding protein
MKNLTIIDKVFYLKRTPLFRMLTMEMLLPIADKLTEVSFDKNDTIFEINDEAHRMYFILNGKVQISAPQIPSPVILENGGFFGDEGLFDDNKRAYNAVAMVDCDILTLTQTNLITIISEYPSVALGFLSVFASCVPDRAKFFLKDAT